MPSTAHGDDGAALEYSREDRASVSARLRVVLTAVFVSGGAVLPIAWWTANGQAFWTALAGLVVGVLSYSADRRGRTDASVFVLLTGMLLSVTATMLVGEGIHDSGMILYPMIIVVGSLVLKPRPYLAIVGLVVASVTVVWWLSWTGRIAAEFQPLTDIDDLLAIVAVLLVQVISVRLLSRDLFLSLRSARHESQVRKAAEDEVRRLNSDLEKRVEARTAELAAANEDLASFSYSVSHDLRAPLRVASNYAAILEQDFAADWDPAARRLLERILASNVRMNRLIDELLNFARLGPRPVTRTRVDMEALARTTIRELTAGAPDRSVEWIVGKLPPAWADAALMEQVFANLIGNAFKYSGRKDHARIEVGFDAADGNYFVTDNGIGFDMRHAKHLFGVFERLHGDEGFEGNGIGLAIVQRILEKHGGRIWADAEPDRGSTFRFQLPAE